MNDIIINEQYEIIKELGNGGFGFTYLVKDLKDSSNPLRVLKEIIPKTENPSSLKNTKKIFEKESKALQKLGIHPYIPDFYDAFEKDNKFYLVQEYVEGHDLSEEIKYNKFNSESKVIELLREVLEILKFVHENDVIHSDIKPNNLMRRNSDSKILLIDFGAVKTITSATNDYSSSIIGVPVYMAPEKFYGKFQLNNDIYSLGIVMIEALTGLHPSNFVEVKEKGEIQWQNFANVSDSFSDILDKMVRSNYQERYQTVNQILLDLQKIDNSNQFNFALQLRIFKHYFRTIFLSPIGLSLGLSLISIMGIFLFINNKSKAIINSVNSQIQTCSLVIGDNLSCGEEILTAEDFSEVKKKGVDAFAEGKYRQAIKFLQEAKKTNDPETLIYLNNAQLIANNIPFYTIAVVTPIGDHLNFGDSGKEILKGVAQVQTDINYSKNKINDFGLRILLVDDYGSSSLTPQTIAENLVKQPDILAVIGHSTSDATQKVLNIYRENKLVLISPTSTAENLAGESDFFFRTVPTNSQMTTALSDYLINTLKYNKVAVFYNPKSLYSESMKTEFNNDFSQLGGQILKEIDLSQQDFDPDTIFQEIAEKEVTSLVFFPDSKINSHAFDNVLKIIYANNNRYLMLGGDSLDTDQILEAKHLANGLIIAIPRNSFNHSDDDLTKKVTKSWGPSVTWRTATAYDATLAIAKALENQKSLPKGLDIFSRRESLQKALKDDQFQIQGVTGKISFDNNGDRLVESNDNSQSIIELVKVISDPCSTNNYVFIPIENKNNPNIKLKCN